MHADTLVCFRTSDRQDPTRWRPNPDAVTCVEARQYYVHVDDGDSDDDETQQRSSTRLTYDVGQDRSALRDKRVPPLGGATCAMPP
eukprot:4584114-Alexandrium_andersonii.AAC.1